MKIRAVLLASTTILLFYACNKEKDNPQPQPVAPKIEIPAESQAVFSQGISWDTAQQSQSQTVKFTTNQPWTADVTDTKASSWLSVQPTSGTAGTVNLTVSAQPNPTTEEREALVTIKCGTATQKFSVRQAGLPKVTSVTLDKAELALVEGDEDTLTATVLPDDAADKTVTWSTSSAEIVTVEEGKVTAVKEGEATITAKAGEIEATCKVTVAKKIIPVESVTLDKAELALVKGDEVTLTATVKPDDATDKAVAWTTSNEAVATVVDGKVKAVGGGSATITAQAGEQSASCAITVTVPVEGITLDKTAVTLEEGKTITLVATVSPSDATDKTVQWSSSEVSVATVNNGVVTAVKVGTAAITALASGKVATCVITITQKVIQVTSVTLSKSSLELKKGQSETLVATVKPDDATDKTVSWSSSNSSIVSVENGKVTAVKSGMATITAKSGEQSATCEVTVTNPVENVSLDHTSVALEEEQTITLVATVTPSDADENTVQWTSSNSSIATVSDGLVKAVAEGEATITARVGDKSADCKVKVTKKIVPVTEVSLDKTSLDLKKGESETLVATVAPEEATEKTVTWSSTDATIAEVDQSGKVTAVKSGKATITAKAGEKTATCTVTVTTPVESVSLDRTNVTLEEGQSTTLVATVKPDDADEKTVEWISTDPSIASVTNGVITTVAEGSTSVTAKVGDKSASCTVTVTKKSVAVTGVSLNKSTLELVIGAKETLVATIKPENATIQGVTWSSSETSVASVSSTGEVTALTVGKTTITVKTNDGEKTATCIVTVSGNTESIDEGGEYGWD